MLWLFLGLAVVFAAIVLYVVATSSPKQVTREDFLAKIEQQTEGRRSVLTEAQSNSFRIDFEFEGYRFWYSDIESEGFTQKVYKGILKLKANTDVNMIFIKKDRKQVLGEMQMMSRISDASINKHMKVFTPAEFRGFDILTQDPYKVNLFLEDRKAKSVLARYKTSDRQGDPYMPISISDGVIFLDFSADENVKPNRPMLMEDVTALEKFADDMIVLAKAFDRITA